MFQKPISSDIIKMYYIHDIISIPPLMSIDIESIKYKCFSFPISNNKSVAIVLLSFLWAKALNPPLPLSIILIFMCCLVT